MHDRLIAARWPLGLFLALFLFSLLWDASGLDRVVMAWFGTASGFPLRSHPWLEKGAHDAVRQAGIGLYLLLLVAAAWPGRWLGSDTRLERIEMAIGTTLALLAVNLLKRYSLTSCPWDLAEFGGVARYVSHWDWGVSDGGGAHCFPGGHSSTAMAFLAVALPGLTAEEPAKRRRGVTLIWVVLSAGLILGAVQTVRGAHYPSHTFWTAWVCWSLAWANRLSFVALRRIHEGMASSSKNRLPRAMER